MSTTAKASPDAQRGEQRDVFVPPAEAPAPAWAATCLNCGVALSGPFCSRCGQRAAPPHPTLRDLGGEAFSEFSGWDGKLASTLKLLFTKPGELTRQFLEGRRAHFISPLRLYLSASVLFFVLASGPASHVVTVGPRAPNVVAPTTEARNRDLLDNLETAPAIMRPLIKRVATDKDALARDVYESLPKALFVLLPAFAAIMLLFYRRWHFAEHLYFSIHIHAFIFATLDLVLLVKYTRSAAVSLTALAIASLWIPLYTHLAIRRVYGGSQVVTFAKELGISALYAAASMPVIALLAIWVAWSTS